MVRAAKKGLIMGQSLSGLKAAMELLGDEQGAEKTENKELPYWPQSPLFSPVPSHCFVNSPFR